MKTSFLVFAFGKITNFVGFPNLLLCLSNHLSHNAFNSSSEKRTLSKSFQTLSKMKFLNFQKLPKNRWFFAIQLNFLGCSHLLWVRKTHALAMHMVFKLYFCLRVYFPGQKWVCLCPRALILLFSFPSFEPEKKEGHHSVLGTNNSLFQIFFVWNAWAVIRQDS